MTLSPVLSVLHVCSILQEHPILLPVPPVNGCAPCWNVFRLYEALAQVPNCEVRGEVVSACTKVQLDQIERKPRQATYRHIVFSELERSFSSLLKRRVALSEAILRRSLKASTWLSLRYLQAVRRLWNQGNYDFIVLDDGPQNLLYLSSFVPRHQLLFLMRGQIGRSRRYLSRIGAIIATNPNLATYAQSVIPVDASQPSVFVVPNSLGDEFEGYSPPMRRAEDGIRQLVFVGRFIPDKGVRELVQAFGIVHARYPEVRLRIVGRGMYTGEAGMTPFTHYEREVIALASTLPEGAVTFAGHVPYEQIPNEYHRADLAIFPSICKEGFGMTALEAMKCGVPVIVSNRPGFTSFVEHGVNGLVVDDPEDVQELAEAMLRIIRDSRMARRFIEAGRATAEMYTPEVSAAMFRSVIQHQRGLR